MTVQRNIRLIEISAFLVFLIITIRLSSLIIQGGFIGGDWSSPIDLCQSRSLCDSTKFLWAHIISFGFHQASLSPSLLFNDFISLLQHYSSVGWVLIAQFSLILCTSSIGMGLMFHYLFGQRFGIAIAIIFFVFSALIFDYLLIGWIYALIALSLLPLCLWTFISGLEGDCAMLLLSGVLFALSPIQSQAVIWYFISFLAFIMVRLFVERKVWMSAKSLLIVLVIFALGNAYWLPALFLYPPSYVTSSDIVNSVGSLGIMGHYQPLNTLRVWGSLFNFQFETIQTSAGLAVVSFFVPVLAIIGLLTARSPYKCAFALLMLSPIVLIFIGNNREILAAMPFANAFRDVPRFSVLSLLGTSVLAGLGADGIVQLAGKGWGRFGKVGAAVILVVGLTGATYPWWSGEMTNWQATKGPDIRLRFKEFPASYFHLESRLAEERLLQKAMYYPLGGTVSFRDDPRFVGAYQETQDIFAMYSPVPGVVAISDRKFGYIDSFMERLAHDEPDRAQLHMLAESGVRLFIFRRNLLGPYPTPSANLVREMIASGEWILWFEDREVVAYAATRFKPVVYTVPVNKTDSNSKAPTVEFRKINPTLYRVRIHNVREPFTLVFNETHNIHWRLALANPVQSGIPSLALETNLDKSDGAASQSELNGYLDYGWLTLPAFAVSTDHGNAEIHPLGFVSEKNEGSIQNNNLPEPAFFDILKMPFVAENTHYIANGFANGWVIDPNKVCNEINSCSNDILGHRTIDLVIEFMPQRVFYIGGVVTIVTYFFLIAGIAYLSFKRFRLRFNS